MSDSENDPRANTPEKKEADKKRKYRKIKSQKK